MFRFFIILIIVLFAGCATHPKPTNKKHTTRYNKPKTIPLHAKHKKTKPPYKLKTNNAISKALYKQYLRWYKTPYKYGGESSYGMDCSYFVQFIYKDTFGIKLPRTTKYQIKSGYFVQRKHLKPGDLVFFKTGYKSRHVGIIIEKANFLHVSTKYGVTISSIYNPYWRKRYWQGRRILPQ